MQGNEIEERLMPPQNPPQNPLRIDVLTLFPEMFVPILGTSIPKRASDKGLVSYHLHDIRASATDAHKSVDDKPFGGGPGMVMMAPVLCDAIDTAAAQDPRPPMLVVMSPQGPVFDQQAAMELSGQTRVMFLCGRYEGIDERVLELTKGPYQARELSIGNYVLSGGELAAMVVIDAIVRLLPGVLGAQDGAADETFADGLLEHPQYTRPREYKGLAVPDILLSGNHKVIAAWRKEQRIKRTQERRPDLMK